MTTFQCPSYIFNLDHVLIVYSSMEFLRKNATYLALYGTPIHEIAALFLEQL